LQNAFVKLSIGAQLTIPLEISLSTPLVRRTALMQYAFAQLDNDASSLQFCNPFFATR
jgi:hypothetical protein